MVPVYTKQRLKGVVRGLTIILTLQMNDIFIAKQAVI